jgi:hypothetical protein
MPTVAVWLAESDYRSLIRKAEERATTTSELAKRILSHLARHPKQRWDESDLMEPLEA